MKVIIIIPFHYYDTNDEKVKYQYQLSSLQVYSQVNLIVNMHSKTQVKIKCRKLYR